MRSEASHVQGSLLAMVTAIAVHLILSGAAVASPAAAAKPAGEKPAAEKPKAKPFCSWAYEVFKDQVGEACRKDLLGRIKDPQDKIFAERIFKNWEPLKGYELIHEGRLIQYIDEKTGDSLQFLWFSQDPWMAMIDGNIVTDNSKDPSLFRRIERMLKKAEETRTAFKLPPLNPLFFLLSNEAYAANNNRRQWVPAFFTIGDSEKDEDDAVYTRERSGTAEQIFSKQGKDEYAMGDHKGEGSLKAEGYLPAPGRHLWIGPQHTVERTCKDNYTLVPHDDEINGHPVKITARNSHTFVVTGYPKEDVTLVVEMKADKGAAPTNDLVRRRDRHNRPMSRKNRNGKWVPWMVPAVPCNGHYNRSMNGRCATVWQDMREEKNADGSYKFPKVREYFEQRDDLDVDGLKYGRAEGVRCSTVFAGDRSGYRACMRYFSQSLPHLRRNYTEGEATYHVCSKYDTADCDKKAVSSRDLAKQYGDDQYSENDGKRVSAGARKDYIDAYRDDDRIPKKYRTEEALAKLCPAGGKCKAPPRGASEDTQDAYEEANKGDEDIYRDERGGEFDQHIERRLLGEMMMGECCRTQSCRDTLKANYNINLEGGKTKKVE